MGEATEIQLQILDENNKLDENSSERQTNGIMSQSKRTYKWWLLMAIYTIFLLAGQSTSTLLGRLYYDKGGNSKWLATLVQVAGFPILIPLYYLSSYKSSNHNTNSSSSINPPSVFVLSGMYSGLGVLLAADCLLFSVGLFYLSVSTYSLICASQLAFNAFFSFFLNSQKFTPFIINSLVLLTISSALLMFQNDSPGSTSVSKGKYVIGFVCTVAASAGYGLMMSLTQFCFQKILKKETFKVVLDMIIYQSLVATLVIIVGLFASGEWENLGREMEGFKLGKSEYVNVLVWIAIGWQVFSIGAVGLILEASSLFSNVISTLGLPIVPLFAMVFFHDPMTGIKVISMVLANWGFVSYVYQHYLDDRNSETGKV
ncbi:putative purine permease 8 [Hibiscus syriacus]|uniref:Probable purine permease n=1 Tax=Hibiscus syriacus TaxID=106335 RepID=A0A6A3AVS9_HIBSY|nr:probable purine permease 10 [Hibiscus syriacus]KAE8708854.1 putative purine permease 8 [Hibiscus syriacus]